MPSTLLRVHALLLAIAAWSATPPRQDLREGWTALKASQPFQDLCGAATRWTGHAETLLAFQGWLDHLLAAPADSLSPEEEMAARVAAPIRDILRDAVAAA